MNKAARSLTLPPGFINSALPAGTHTPHRSEAAVVVGAIWGGGQQRWIIIMILHDRARFSTNTSSRMLCRKNWIVPRMMQEVASERLLRSKRGVLPTASPKPLHTLMDDSDSGSVECCTSCSLRSCPLLQSLSIIFTNLRSMCVCKKQNNTPPPQSQRLLFLQNFFFAVSALQTHWWEIGPYKRSPETQRPWQEYHTG